VFLSSIIAELNRFLMLNYIELFFTLFPCLHPDAFSVNCGEDGDNDYARILKAIRAKNHFLDKLLLCYNGTKSNVVIVTMDKLMNNGQITR
jgi:hypothetical protein